MKSISKSFGACAGLTGISVMAFLAACTGTDGAAGAAGTAGKAGAAGASGTNAVTRTTKEAASASCANGGSKVDFGQDSNGNGVLDDSEVSGSVLICDGTSGEAGVTPPAPLVEGVTLSPGDPNCPSGGLEVKTGVDMNGNGVLDTGEYVASYSCNGAATRGDAGPVGATGATGEAGAPGEMGATGEAGAPGEMGATGDAGAPGLSSLIKMTVEPIGPNCGNGGVRIDSGLDTNSDGVLDITEITSTAYVCSGPPPCLDIKNTADVDLADNNWFDACAAAPGSNVAIIAYDSTGAILYRASGTKVGVPWTQDTISFTDDPGSEYSPNDASQKIQLTNGDWLVIAGKDADNGACQGALGDGYGILIYADPPDSYPSNLKLAVMSYAPNGDTRDFANWGPDYEISWNGGATMNSCSNGADGFQPLLGRVTFTVY